MSNQSASASGPDSGVRIRGFGTRRRVLRESRLEWFFSSGQSLFEASTFGALLERQAHYGQEFEPCEACAGSGFTADDGTCGECGGIGGRPQKLTTDGVGVASDTSGHATSRCPKCHGAGELFNPKREGSPRTPLGASCLPCRGRGYGDRSPVAVGGSRGDEPSYTVDDASLALFAQVSRWLIQIPSWSVEVLEAYYGLSGYRWGATKWGRLLAVLPLTKFGKAMLGKLNNPCELPDHELLGNYVEQIERIDDLARRMQAKKRLQEGIREADHLFASAAVRWNAAVEGSHRKPDPDPGEPAQDPKPTEQEAA